MAKFAFVSTKMVLFFILFSVAQLVFCLTLEDEGIIIEDEGVDGKAVADSKSAENDFSKQLPALVRGFYSSFRSASPVFLLTSVALGMLISAFLLESPLSSFPVPPLPYPPLGKFPPKEAAIPINIHHYKPDPGNNFGPHRRYNQYKTHGYGRSLGENILGMPKVHETETKLTALYTPNISQSDLLITKPFYDSENTNEFHSKITTNNESDTIGKTDTVVYEVKQSVFSDVLRALSRFLMEVEKDLTKEKNILRPQGNFENNYNKK